MLTGDKIETAINIGFACELLNNRMILFTLSEKKTKKIMNEVLVAVAKQGGTSKKQENAVVIAGDTLLKI